MSQAVNSVPLTHELFISINGEYGESIIDSIRDIVDSLQDVRDWSFGGPIFIHRVHKPEDSLEDEPFETLGVLLLIRANLSLEDIQNHPQEDIQNYIQARRIEELYSLMLPIRMFAFENGVIYTVELDDELICESTHMSPEEEEHCARYCYNLRNYRINNGIIL